VKVTEKTMLGVTGLFIEAHHIIAYTFCGARTNFVAIIQADGLCIMWAGKIGQNTTCNQCQRKYK
jgi:hypothetical protein